jgi:hypothetical protein
VVLHGLSLHLITFCVTWYKADLNHLMKDLNFNMLLKVQNQGHSLPTQWNLTKHKLSDESMNSFTVWICIVCKFEAHSLYIHIDRLLLLYLLLFHHLCYKITKSYVNRFIISSWNAAISLCLRSLLLLLVYNPFVHNSQSDLSKV